MDIALVAAPTINRRKNSLDQSKLFGEDSPSHWVPP